MGKVLNGFLVISEQQILTLFSFNHFEWIFHHFREVNFEISEDIMIMVVIH